MTHFWGLLSLGLLCLILFWPVMTRGSLRRQMGLASVIVRTPRQPLWIRFLQAALFLALLSWFRRFAAAEMGDAPSWVASLFVAIVGTFVATEIMAHLRASRGRGGREGRP